MRVGAQCHPPASLTTANRAGTHFTGFLEPVWTAQKISSPPIFEHRTVQPVAYTDYAIPADMNI
jgi:hypothetical protein